MKYDSIGILESLPYCEDNYSLLCNDVYKLFTISLPLTG